MERDISKIKRNLECKKDNDIIYKKKKLEEMFHKDPDLLEILGKKEKRPLNKYKDANNPTEEELAKRQEIIDFNEKLNKKQIIDIIKLNGIQKEVLNFIMFDIEDRNVSFVNNVIKNQEIIVMCLVHEDDLDTEYNIKRTDLLSYIIKDLLCWSNVLGTQLKCIADYPDIIDSRYYARTLKFNMETPNHQVNGVNNRYDKFRK